jgi:hypothetical protein
MSKISTRNINSVGPRSFKNLEHIKNENSNIHAYNNLNTYQNSESNK